MSHLFAYGTLMCTDIMEEVSGLQLPGVPALLQQYRRFCVRGEVYPAIIADADGDVDGVVYRNIPQSAWIRLDRFEGEMYARQMVEVVLAAGARIPAVTYVLRTEFTSCLEASEWDLQTFLRDGKDSFCQSYSGYRTLE
jgi:gamma-glutamylcyclotransferase (GGCT)/AIG2-like uncharacterized protein YtfP